ncbi:MAG: hydrolase, partial [Gemmatimonadota bacterium]|nr:hydrolase [Gemmatimonadota bacterium]
MLVMHRFRAGPRAPTPFCFAALLAALLAVQTMQTAGTASAQEREIVPLRILEALHMDGVLDEGVWQNALAASGFTQQRPDEGQPATERTEVRVLYDEQTMYIGVWAYDSDPSQIIATQMARDGDLADDDYFQIILDTFMDRQNGILFAT